MALHVVQPQPRVGNDAIPVVHELALGEDRQVGQRSAVGDGRADGLAVIRGSGRGVTRRTGEAQPLEIQQRGPAPAVSPDQLGQHRLNLSRVEGGQGQRILVAGFC